MDAVIAFVNEHWQEFIVPTAIFIGVIIGAFIFERITFPYIGAWVARTKTKTDDQVFGTFKRTYWIWVLVLAVYLGFRSYPFTGEMSDFWMRFLSLVFTVVATFFLANLAVRLFQIYANRPGSHLPTNSITENIIRAIIFIIGALIILRILEQDITPWLATLGIGGLAVALAVQPMLSNIFAGTQIIGDKAIQKGDFIQLDSDIKGRVVDITWRSTRLQTPYGTLVVVPNSKLADSIITNYNGAGSAIGFLVYGSVSYSSDLDKVEKVALDAANEIIRELDEADKSSEPTFRYEEFGDSNIVFWLWLTARDRSSSFKLKSEMIKRLHLRFAAEGIVHSFPIRSTYVHMDAQMPFIEGFHKPEKD